MEKMRQKPQFAAALSVAFSPFNLIYFPEYQIR